MKNILLFIGVLTIIGGVVYFLSSNNKINTNSVQTDTETVPINNKEIHEEKQSQDKSTSLNTAVESKNILEDLNTKESSSVKVNYKIVTGSGFTFEAPSDWILSDVTVDNGCTADGVIGYPFGIIYVWTKKCFASSGLSYHEDSTIEKDGYVITLSYSKQFEVRNPPIEQTEKIKQIEKIKAVYQHVVDTFKIK